MSNEEKNRAGIKKFIGSITAKNKGDDSYILALKNICDKGLPIDETIFETYYEKVLSSFSINPYNEAKNKKKVIEYKNPQTVFSPINQGGKRRALFEALKEVRTEDIAELIDGFISSYEKDINLYFERHFNLIKKIHETSISIEEKTVLCNLIAECSGLTKSLGDAVSSMTSLTLYKRFEKHTPAAESHYKITGRPDNHGEKMKYGKIYFDLYANLISRHKKERDAKQKAISAVKEQLGKDGKPIPVNKTITSWGDYYRDNSDSKTGK